MTNLKETINQLFILGYEGEDFRSNIELVKLLENGLGGVIFFTQNILDENKFKSQTELIKSISKIPPFLSIDEEGGRVERFENLNKDCPDGKKYLSAKYIAQKGENAIVEQSQNIADDLNEFGLNMNFAPVLDVNSNPYNPIIGERAYSNDPKIVTECAKLVSDTFLKNKILPVYKHFPGHGDTKKDSHLELPIVDLDFKEFEKTHIYPFKKMIEYNKLDEYPDFYPYMIMIAHVHYTCFDGEDFENNLTPASTSINVLNYLRNNLQYDGVVISDDMEMGGIKGFNPVNTIIKMLKAGVNCFIYRNCNSDVVSYLEELEKFAKKDEELQTAIWESYEKITKLKKVFGIITL